jgi:hypothetical protein
MKRSCDNKIEKLLDKRDAHIRDQVRRAIALISVSHSVEFVAKKVRLIYTWSAERLAENHSIIRDAMQRITSRQMPNLSLARTQNL